MRRFSARDDLLHDVSASGPYARESLLLTAPIPDQQLLVFVYLWREQGQRWGRFLFIGGPDMTAPEYLSYQEHAQFDGTDLDDCVVGGLRLRQPEPLHTAQVEFADDELELALRFRGIHEPFSWHDNAHGCPDWVADDRYEQSGLAEGTLVLRGRRVEWAGAGHRDHSWGARNWKMLQHWKWINATVDHTRSLHAMIMDARGERLVNGYLNVGGEVSPVVTAQATAELDDRMIHRGISGHFRDEAGREMTLDADFAAGWQMPIRHLLLNEVGMRAKLDGHPAVAHVELGWPADYVRGLIEDRPGP